jgi:hypothetical protein
MPTLIELFQSKILKSGQTAEKQYEIQNLKPIPVKTNSGVIDVLVTPVNILRRNLGSRLRETRLEQEVLGIRQLRTFSSPVLYGTAIAKLITKQSSSVITMKNASSTLETSFFGDGGGGLIARLVEKAKDAGKGVLSKLGIQLPEAQIPTRVANNLTGQLIFGAAGFPISPDKLRQIKETSQGNGAGRILASIGQGATGQQIKNQVLGAGINAAKAAGRKALLGAVSRIRKTATEETAAPSIRPSDVSYNSKRKYSNIIKIRYDVDDSVSDFGNFKSLKGLQDYIDKPIQMGGGLFGMLAAAGAVLSQPEGLFIMNKNINDTLNYANPKSPLFTTNSSFPEFSLNSITQNIPAKRDLKKPTYSKSGAVSRFLIDSEKKPKFKTKKDLVNISKPWYSATGIPGKLSDETTIDDYDFIPLRFYSVKKQTGVSFKATINGLNETISPSWDSNRFLGNAYNFYTYNSIERSVSFSFKVYSLNQQEHLSAWQKLNFLAGLAYPQNTTPEVFTSPPFLKFTLGDMYKNKECFIESLSFEIDDNTPWEVGLNPIKNGNRIGEVNDKGITTNWKLPTIVNVNTTIKFIETQGTVAGKQLYGYGGQFGDILVSDYGINGDGSAKKIEPTAKTKKSYLEDFKNL